MDLTLHKKLLTSVWKRYHQHNDRLFASSFKHLPDHWDSNLRIAVTSNIFATAVMMIAAPLIPEFIKILEIVAIFLPSSYTALTCDQVALDVLLICFFYVFECSVLAVMLFSYYLRRSSTFFFIGLLSYGLVQFGNIHLGI